MTRVLIWVSALSADETSDCLPAVGLMDRFPTLAGANDLVQAGEPWR